MSKKRRKPSRKRRQELAIQEAAARAAAVQPVPGSLSLPLPPPRQQFPRVVTTAIIPARGVRGKAGRAARKNVLDELAKRAGLQQARKTRRLKVRDVVNNLGNVAPVALRVGLTLREQKEFSGAGALQAPPGMTTEEWLKYCAGKNERRRSIMAQTRGRGPRTVRRGPRKKAIRCP